MAETKKSAAETKESAADLWVCPLCGGAEIEHIVWADPNTEKVLDTVDFDEDHWCRDCGEHVERFVRQSEFDAGAR